MKATPPRLELACRKGCGYCCHTWVSATAPEIFLLARTLQAMPGTPRLSKDAILERAGTTAGLGIAERFGRKLPCALLVDDSCSMYASRPTVCRQATSTELAACIEEYEGKDFEGDIVVSKALNHAGIAPALRAAARGSETERRHAVLAFARRSRQARKPTGSQEPIRSPGSIGRLPIPHQFSRPSS